MTTHSLPFVQIIILQEDIAEVIVNEGVELNLEALTEINEILISNLKSPYSLLINKRNHYSLSLEVQQQLSTLKKVNARAVVVYDLLSEANASMITVFAKGKTQKHQVFQDRESALEWLQTIQRNSRASV